MEFNGNIHVNDQMKIFIIEGIKGIVIQKLSILSMPAWKYFWLVDLCVS